MTDENLLMCYSAEKKAERVSLQKMIKVSVVNMRVEKRFPVTMRASPIKR
jgi:hypothetical protein